MICTSCNGTGIAHMPDISGENDDWLEETHSLTSHVCGTCDGTGQMPEAAASDIPGAAPERVVGEVLAADEASKRVVVRLTVEIRSGQTYWFSGMEALPFRPGVLWVKGAMCSLAAAGSDVEFELDYHPLAGALMMQRTS